MKVLFFNYEYPPLGGGAANATFCILREFAKIEHLEVDLVTSSHDEAFHLEKIGEFIRVHKLPISKSEATLHFQSQKDLLKYSWVAYRYSKKLLKKNYYDLSHSFFSVPCGFLSFLFLWQYKIPYIISLRGADVPGYSERFTGLYSFLKPLIKLIWKKAAFVVSNSEGLKELALKSKPDREILVIPNGINISKFRPDFEKINDDEIVITLGGTRITKRKGISYLIMAIAELIKKYPQIKLKIVGEGNEKKNLEDLVKKLGLEDHVIFYGRVDNSKLPPFYQEASFFVLPSLNEGMSNAMLEALACGLPILATDTGGTKELVRDSENGFILEMMSEKDIAEKIEKLIIDPDLARKMGENSRKIAEDMSWEKVAKSYYKLYKDIAQENE